jgi:UDP-N-acetylglucosamine 1-carboxyvinyltransferase
MLPLTTKLIDIGATVEEKGDSIRVYMEKDKKIEATNVTTAPYPGFPTDLQPQLGVCLALADGKSVITENIWQSRFQYTVELNKMGANIIDNGTSAVFNGVSQLKGTKIEASDLRAGAALIIAALAADGQTELSNIHFVDRGYEGVEEKFRKLGANIQRV